MIIDPNEPLAIQAADRQLWIRGELRAKYVELCRRQRQAVRDGLLLLGFLFLHVAVLTGCGIWCRPLVRALGIGWVGVGVGQWFCLVLLRCWICRQPWWQIRSGVGTENR